MIQINGPNQKMRENEHSALRAEILQNKKYMFERPLLIISAAAVAYGQVGRTGASWFIPILLVALLWMNLLFTDDRIRSTARITEYVALCLESQTFDWIGWENALRRYRHVFDGKKLPSPFPDRNLRVTWKAMHTSQFWLNSAPVVIAVAGLGVAIWDVHTWKTIAIGVATAAAATGFSYYCFLWLTPGRYLQEIDYQRAKWVTAFQANLEEKEEDELQ